jgi:hypothetical protein
MAAALVEGFFYWFLLDDFCVFDVFLASLFVFLGILCIIIQLRISY